MKQRGSNAELCEELVTMAEKGRAVRADFVERRPNVPLSPDDGGALSAQRRAASWAAMWVLHHAIGSPRVMRRGLGLLRAAERRGEVDPLNVALHEDRILTLEGRPQQYGSQVDWDDNGVLSPLPIADLSDVDVRRRAVGLVRWTRTSSRSVPRLGVMAKMRPPISLRISRPWRRWREKSVGATEFVVPDIYSRNYVRARGVGGVGSACR
jgi:hypothetical protein